MGLWGRTYVPSAHEAECLQDGAKQGQVDQVRTPSGAQLQAEAKTAALTYTQDLYIFAANADF